MLGRAVAVTVWMPLPVPAVRVKLQLVLAVADVCLSVCAPVSLTHRVSLDVTTVKVRAPPFFA